MRKKSLQDLIKDKQVNLTDDDKKKAEIIKEGTKQYNNMSKDQLLGEIIKKKRTSKTVNDNTLNQFEDYLMPMLDDKQKSRLKEIMKQLKD